MIHYPELRPLVFPCEDAIMKPFFCDVALDVHEDSLDVHEETPLVEP